MLAWIPTLIDDQQFERAEVRRLLWLNGNVPIALQRWVYPGTEDDANKLRCASVLEIAMLWNRLATQFYEPRGLHVQRPLGWR